MSGSNIFYHEVSGRGVNVGVEILMVLNFRELGSELKTTLTDKFIPYGLGYILISVNARLLGISHNR